MNSRMPPIALAYPPSPVASVRERPLDLRQLFRFLLSNSMLVANLTALFVMVALVYVTVTPPTFVSSAQLMLESQKATAADVQRMLAEEALVEGQMEIMKSGDVLQAVVKTLDLKSDPEFKSAHLPIADLLRSLFSIGPSTEKAGLQTARSPEEQAENYTIATLRSRLWIRRVGQSTVIEISAASSNPRKTALIANAVAEQYIAQNVRMKSQSALQSSEWLAQRVAELREAVFAADRAVIQFQSSGDSGSQFKLTELKSVSETYRRLYETYLQSWSEAKQRISYPVSDAIFVSRATVPVAKSQPKSILLLAFALVLGLSFGVVVAIVRHFANRLITSADRISAEASVPCIGEVSQANRVKKGATTDLLRFDGPGRKPGKQEWFGRDLRDLKATLGGLRRNQKANLIGLVGAEARAGSTTLAYNLALLASASGSKTLLIDACATNPTLSRVFGEEKATGLMELLNDPRAYADFIARIEKRLTILPIGSFRDVTPGERIGSERIAFSFADLKERFDLVLVDLPSMPESADAKSIAPYLDGSIVVARYGKSSFDTLVEAVDALRDVGTEIFGVVLNAVPQRKK
ncbi:Wzz/FepE/Etk N-terminal domain-containing protein [Pararhizobium sp. BT-229]|uniref:GumC family protein n=1 Tax=Pararhizobium sp. BT-229 TaxID=2986923 RepID=UPI0021F6EE1B|nr:tyrosine-protein kinase domain-containing protein [Pararhizobium sp. BT-229]MCV9967742.1 Wzz/FepE/Etk N-terminal domain-containing protein [Pararhizobium sp. BT-229]